MKNLKLSYLKIATIILTVHVLEMYSSKDLLGFLLLGGAILFIEFIFGDLSSEAAKKLKLKKSESNSGFVLFILTLPGAAVLIFSYSYFQDNHPDSFITIAAVLFYGFICYQSYVVDFINKRNLDREREN